MSAKAGIRCFFCDRMIDTEILRESPIELAERKGWAAIIVNGNVAFICPRCRRFFSFSHLEVKNDEGNEVFLRG